MTRLDLDQDLRILVSDWGEYRIVPTGSMAKLSGQKKTLLSLFLSVASSALISNCSNSTLVNHRLNTFVYVANYNDVTISGFVLNSDGSLKSVGTFNTGGFAPYNVVTDSTNQFLYSANYTSGVWNNNSAFKINPATGALSLLRTFGASYGVIAGSPVSSFIYSPDNTGAYINIYPIDPNTGNPQTAVSYSNPWNSLVSMRFDPTGRFMYAADSGLSFIKEYTVNTSTGALSFMGNYSVGAQDLVVHPSSQFVYIAPGTTYVRATSVNSVTGVLSLIGSYGAGSSFDALAVDPGGRYLYAGDFSNNTIVTFQINTSNGTLTQLSSISSTSPNYLAVDSTGTYLLASSSTTNNVNEFKISSQTGALTSIGSSPVGAHPVGITFVSINQ